MPEKQFVIFIVDDDALLRMVLMDQLADKNYILHEFDSGVACLNSMHLKPNLILLDIEMPGKSGIEVCQQLRTEGNTEVQVIFVSSNEDLDVLLQVFDAGGNDYFPKNSPKDLLLRKVDLARTQEIQKRLLKSQITTAQSVAFTAMSNLGEAGILLQFFRTSFTCKNLQQLGTLIIDVFQQFNIKGLVRLSDGSQEHDFGAEVICTPLEKSILSYVAKLGRIFQSKDRLVLNFPHITILILDLDLADNDSLGRLRDNLAIMAEGIDVSINVITTEQLKLHNAQQVAFTAMSSLGETGVMLQFLRSSFTCENLQQLGSLIVEVFQQFGLKGLIRLTNEFQQSDFSSSGACNPSDEALLTHVAQLGRIHQFEDRLVVNYPNITMLLLELNVEDSDVIGRLRDNLAIMAEGSGVRIDAMVTERNRLDSAQQVAFTAMSSLGETGIMLQFLRATFSCDSLQNLGPLVVDTLQQFNLTGLIRLSNNQEEFDFSTGNACSFSEKMLLNHAAQMERIHQSHDHLIVNYPHTTLLISELESADAELIGRLRDNLAIIAEGIGVRIDAMATEQYRLHQAESQLANIKQLNALFDEVEQHQQSNRNQFELLVEQHSATMENAFVSLGLTDAQETMLHNAVEHLSHEMELLFDNEHRLSLKLHEIIASQKKMLGHS